MQPPELFGKNEDTLRVKRIECEEIVLRKGNGPAILLSAGTDTSGIWIGDAYDGTLMAIYVGQPGHNGMGFYGPGQRKAMTITMGTSKDGEPCVQVVSAANDIVMLDHAALKKLQS